MKGVKGMKDMKKKTLLVLGISILASSLALAARGGQAVPAAPGPPALGQLVLPAGFQISVFAENVEGARQMALGARGTVFVGSRPQGKVYAVVDANNDRKADAVKVIASGLMAPNGVAFRDGALFVAESHRIIRFDDIENKLDAPPAPVVVKDNLPTPKDNHSWKFIAFGPDGLLYVPTGAPCNICAPPPMTAAILRMRPDGSNLEVFAEGVRNTVGFDWSPVTRELWFSDNGRDMLGDDVPNDELNVAPKPGLHFGFPFCHQGDTPDPEFGSKKPCSETQAPVLKVGPHVGSVGVAFYTGSMFPASYRNAIILVQHGSWNRSIPIGYRVMVARVNGQKVTGYEPLVDGFLPGVRARAPNGRGSGGPAIARPVDVLELADGSVLISDDSGHRIFRLSYGK
jgi:glucose/arabinose dehydrogenase